MISSPVARWDVPRADLQQRIGEEVADPAPLLVVEVTFDEDDIGDGHGAPEREPQRGRAGRDGLGAGVVVAGIEP